MKQNQIIRILLVFVLSIVTLPLTTGATSTAHQNNINGKIDPYVLDRLGDKDHTNIFVKIAGNADLDAAERIVDRRKRLEFVYTALTSHADLSQKFIIRFLNRRGIDYEIFWINNSLYLYNADLSLVEELAQRNDVAFIRGDHNVPLHFPVGRVIGQAGSESVVWNVTKINADDLWVRGITGEGIVVANIDTGVRYTHDALVNQYRGNNGNGTFTHDYNWYDPSMRLAEPSDVIGHGTHTMGTMIGGDGLGEFGEDIGVAPGAKWIAAKGCGLLFCTDFRLISAAQWIACPTKMDGSDPDCSKAPHVVNNSWGGSGGDDWYQSYIRSWLMAGISPVFSIGNGGPDCGTAGSPGDYNFVAGVGATDINDVLTGFSSRGPGDFRWLKPDFVAPGENILSSFSRDDSGYAVLSGTSMASPHVSGAIALLLSAHPGESLVDIYNALRDTTVRDLGVPPGSIACAGRVYNEYPNAIYGWGRIDVAAALEAITP